MITITKIWDRARGHANKSGGTRWGLGLMSMLALRTDPVKKCCLTEDGEIGHHACLIHGVVLDVEHIPNSAAVDAHHVVVGTCVRIKPLLPARGPNDLDVAIGVQDFKVAIHGAQTDFGKIFPDHIVHLVRCGMGSDAT